MTGLAELRAAARAHAIEEETAVLRHALRNKLAAVRNANAFLRRRLAGAPVVAEDPRIAQFFELVDVEVRGASDLIEGTGKPLPDASRAPRIDAREVVASVAAAFAPAVVPIEGNARARADGSDLAIAVFSLLENAFEAGGTPRVSIAARDGRAFVAVEDDGSIADEALTRAFDPGFTTKPGRAGLGLNVARRLVTRWGGDLELGRGAAGLRATIGLRSGDGP